MVRKDSLDKGTKVYFSEKGHNNFFYPTKETETLIEDTKAIFPAWVGCDGLRAALIPESSVYVSGSETKFIVVWTSK